MPEYSVCSPPQTEHVRVKVAQSCLTLCDPRDYTVHGILQARILEWGAYSLLQGIFTTQGLNPGLPHCRQILYQLSHKGSPIPGWVAYSLLQQIFLTQESNQGLLHCRWILYQLSYWGSPPKLEIWPPQNNWTSKLWNIHIFKDYLATKRNKLLTCSITRKNLSYYDERKKTNKITEQTLHNSIYVKVHKMQAKLEWQAADQRPHGDRSKGILGKIGNTEEHKEISGDDKIILILMTA